MQKSSERNDHFFTDDKVFHIKTPSDKEHSITPEKEDMSGILQHIRDVNCREIFKNNTLTCQFLKDYSGISLFSDIRPDDIEDQTSRFKEYLGIEIEGDTIKRIRVKLDDQEEEIYVISMIEHKSQVDYDVAMQQLHYMSAIWRDYAKGCDKQKEKISKRKYFRYPLIIPIIYYEGTGKWTAGMHLSDRISHAELAMDCIPDFTYRIVPLKDYANQELIEHNNEMSLIMMINKIHGADDFHDFRMTGLDYMQSIYGQTSANIQNLILEVVRGLLLRIDVPKEEVTDMVNSVREDKNMGVLFENFQKFDWREAQEMREEAQKMSEEAQKMSEEAQKMSEEAQKKSEEAQKMSEEAQKMSEEAQKMSEEAQKKIKITEKIRKEAETRADKAEAELRKAEVLIAELQQKLSNRQ